MDTNAFASTGSPQGQQTPNPQSQPGVNGTIPGGVNSILQALMAGNEAYKQKQASQAGAQGINPMMITDNQPNPMAGMGQPRVAEIGQQQSAMPTPPTDPNTMTGGLGQPNQQQMAGMGQIPVNQLSMLNSPFTGGGMDPVSNALMSPIPGSY